MSSSSRILAAVSALALAAAAAAPLAGAAYNPAPKLLKGSPILFVDNEINKGVAHSNSLATFVKDKKPAYIAYVGGVSVAGGGEHLKVGHRYKVTISLGHQEVTRTVELQKNTKESVVERQLGY